MQIDFKVENINKTTTGATAKVDGADMAVTMPCLEVELTTRDPRHGSLTLRFVGQNMAEAEAYFVPGRTVSWNID